jgi:hypothetical protein
MQQVLSLLLTASYSDDHGRCHILGYYLLVVASSDMTEFMNFQPTWCLDQTVTSPASCTALPKDAYRTSDSDCAVVW